MSITDRQFYLFLNSYQDWKKHADEEYGVGSGAGDGELNRGEFSKFVRAEWAKGGTGDSSAWNGESTSISNSIINKFWAKFDTDSTSDKNYNKLDDDEYANMNKGVQAYAKVRDLVNGLQVPSDFKINDKTVLAWRNMVYSNLETLADAYVGNNCEGEFEIPEEQVAQAQSLATAYCYKDMLVKNLGADIKQSLKGYDLTNDKTLTDKITEYINNLNATEFDANAIKSAIQGIIDEYLATVGIGTVAGFNNFPQDDNANINELQKHMATKHLETLFTDANLNSLGCTPDTKDAFVDSYKAYIEGQIANAVTVADYKRIMEATFDSVKAAAFENIEEIIAKQSAKKELEKLFAALELDANKEIKVDAENNALHKAISEKYSTDVQTAMQYFNKIMKDVKTQILENFDEYLNEDNTLNVEKVTQFVIAEIEKLKAASGTDGTRGDSQEDLSDYEYDKLKEYSNNYLNGLNPLEDSALANAVNHAVNVCNQLANMSDRYKAEILKTLNINDISDLSDRFGQCKILQEVKNLMNDVWAACDATVRNLSNWIVPETLSMVAGDYEQIPMAPIITDKSGKPVSAKIEYKVSSTNPATIVQASSNNSGLLTISPANPGNEIITIGIYVDGELMGEKTINLTVYNSAKASVDKVKDWDDQISKNLEVFNVEGAYEKQLTECDFATLYNSEAIIRLHIDMDDDETWSEAKDLVSDRLQHLGDLIYSALSTSGDFNLGILKQAKDNVVARYLNEANGDLNDDDSGTSELDLTDNMCEHMNSNRQATGHKIWGTRDDDGWNSYVWGVRFNDLVDDIVAEYYNLLGAK